MPSEPKVGDEFSIAIIGDDRQSESNIGEYPTLRFCNGECTVKRFANPFPVDNTLGDGEPALELKIREIDAESVVIDIELFSQVKYRGHSDCGIPASITLDHR